MRGSMIIMMVSICFLSACDSKGGESIKSKSLDTIEVTGIPVDTVVHILGDIHFAHVAAQVNRKVNSDSLKVVYEDQVLKIHGITEQEYKAMKSALENDLNLYYTIEQKVHVYLKSLREDKKD